MTTAKFFLDFELQGQSPRLTQNPNFWEFIFEAKFWINLNTNFAPKIELNIARWFTIVAKHVLLT